MSELEEKVERMEKILLLTWKLAKAVKRGHNKVTNAFNENFEIFEENIMRNSVNIDKMVKTLQELVGDAVEYDKKHGKEKINQDCKMMFL